MKKLKLKFYKWLFEKVKTNDLFKENIESILENDLKVYFYTYKDSLFYNIDKELDKIIFNAKYFDIVSNRKPYDALQELYIKAKRGDNSFIVDPLYRALKEKRDSHQVKLLTIMKKTLR